MPRLDRSVLTSPAAALAYQKAQETLITGAMEAAVRSFVKQLSALALDQPNSCNPPAVRQRWEHAVRFYLERAGQDPETADYLLAQDSSVPDAAYDAAMLVLRESAMRGWSFAMTAHEMQTALDPDTADPTPHSALEAAGFWSDLTETGNRWIVRVRRDVRTGATGLYGSMAQVGLRTFGFDGKRWVTRHDALVRDSHFDADGQVVPVESPFMVGGEALMYPGERGAVFAEVVNCRCVMVGVALP
jgi:hypothetical protein